MRLNRPLTLSEKIRACRMQNEILPLKGHMKIVLEDIRDGSQKILEQDNMITQALHSILNHNYNGDARYDLMMPLHNQYGGVFCYQNTQTELASAYDFENDLVNPLIAHAGSEANNTGSTLRGSPVSNETVISDISISRTWIWDNTQGNGHIESVSLVGGTMGNMGLKPFDDSYNPMSEIGNDGALGSYGMEYVGTRYPFSIDDDGKTARTIELDGTSFTEYHIRHDYFAIGIMRSVRDWQVIDSRTATLTRSGSNRIVFDDADYYYICRASSSTALAIDKVSKSTFAVSQADVQYSNIALYTGDISDYFKGNGRPFAFDGTYLYFPNSTATGFIKLNLSDNTDVTVLDGTITVHLGAFSGASATHGEEFMTPIVLNEGLILGDNYLINGNKVYSIAQVKQIGTSDEYIAQRGWLWTVKKGASCYGNAFQSSGGSNSAQTNILLQAYKGSIVNLAQARDKTTSQTMRIIYSLTEQTS